MTRDGLENIGEMEKLGLEKTMKRPQSQDCRNLGHERLHLYMETHEVALNLERLQIHYIAKLVQTNAAEFVVSCTFRISICVSASIQFHPQIICLLPEDALYPCVASTVPGFEPSLLVLGPCHVGGGSSASCALCKRVGSQRAAESFRALPGGALGARQL